MPQRRPRTPKPPTGETPPDDLQALFGQRLQAERIKQNKTQLDLAEAAGLTHQYVSKIEDGQINVTLDTMKKLATVLDHEVSELLRRAEREEERHPPPKSD